MNWLSMHCVRILLFFVSTVVCSALLASCDPRRDALVLSEASERFRDASGLPLESAAGQVILVNDTKTFGEFDGETPEISRAERVVSALRLAYPHRITDAEIRDGDWAVLVGKEWFYWAEGRLLPNSERKNWKKYDAVPFYPYTEELLPVPSYSREEKTRLAEMVKQMDASPVRRHTGFYNALWRVHDRTSSYNMVKTIYFLGVKAQIHRELLEDLSAVEEEIQAAMKNNRPLSGYVGNIRELNGYNWRAIAGTSSLSFHAYGTAIDIIPKSYSGKQVYWRWALSNFPEWFSLPYADRFMPPPEFIRAFENHGFVWGGKWLFYDTIHFEYRPEIFFLNDIPVRN